ncbi:hypothetical protein MMPV_003782 [Pyropia vietnamensis]
MGAAYSSLVFRPPAVTYEVDSDGKMMFVRRVGGGRMAPSTEPVMWLRTSRGSVIPAVYLAVEGAETVLLMSHTNAEDLGMAMTHAAALADTLHVNVFSYEYTGYGLSKPEGPSSEAALYADATAAYVYLTTTLKVPPHRIVALGRSLGSGPSLYLATGTFPVGGVILVSALLSCVRVALRGVPVTPAFDMFPNIDRVRGLTVPLLVVHARDDTVVPFRHGVGLARAAAAPRRREGGGSGGVLPPRVETLWFDEGGHNGVEADNWEALMRAAELAVVPYLATADMPPVLSAPAGVSGIADEAEVAPAVPFLRTLSLTSVGVTHVPALPPRPAPLQPVVSSPALADAGVAPAVEQALTGRAPDASEGGGDSAVDVARKCGNAMWTGSYPAGAAIPTSPTPMAAVVPPISSRPSSPLLRPGWIAGDGGSGGGGGWGGFRPGP